MTELKNKKPTIDEIVFGNLITYIAVILPLVLVLLTIVFFKYGEVAPSEIGQIGQFFGGWLTPITVALTMVLLIFSIRFQVHQLKLTRQELKRSAGAHQQSAQIQQDLLNQSERSFKLESNAKGLINLSEQGEYFLNTKVNLYVDIINFDNKLPHETRLYNLIDNWQKELEQNPELSIKCRNERDKKYIGKYLHNLHHQIYVCQSLIKNEGWVYLSPYLSAVQEQIEAALTMYHVKLIDDKAIWQIKQAVNSIYNKVSHIKDQGVVLDDEIIAKMIKETYRELLMQLPTPERFQYDGDKEAPVTPPSPTIVDS